MASEGISASGFSSSDRDVVERSIAVPQGHSAVSRDDLGRFFDLTRCAQFVTDGNYSKVALQFPDSQLCYSTAVVTLLSELAPTCQLFILADTSYGSCCVDEVAAEHIAAEAVIHFGHTCLSSVRRLPVFYAFGREPVDVGACAGSFRDVFPDSTSHVLLLCDTTYESCLESLSSKLQPCYQNISVGRIAGQAAAHSQQQQQQQQQQPDSDLTTTTTTTTTTSSCFLRRPSENDTASSRSSSPAGANRSITTYSNRLTRCGREFVLADGSVLGDYSVFFVGSSDMALNNHLMTFSSLPFFLYDPRQSTPCAELQTAKANRSLKRRYVMMLKAKEAKTVGLLAGTLGVADYMTVMRRLKQVMTTAGKKVYTFSLGKLNVAKLANFPEIDAFVLVACPESTLISSEDFYKPVVTPYEMEVACVRSREWTGDYVTDFRLLLPGAAHYLSAGDDGKDTSMEPEFSLITGGLLSRPCDIEDVTTDSQALVTRSDGQVATVDAGAAFLASRTWGGLDPQLGQTRVPDTIVEGRSGIAMGYNSEPGYNSCDQLAAGFHCCCGLEAGSTACCQSQQQEQEGETTSHQCCSNK